MMPGPAELVMVLVIALVVFGPKKLPDLGRSLGGGMRNFKEAVAGSDPSDELRELTRREPEPDAADA